MHKVSLLWPFLAVVAWLVWYALRTRRLDWQVVLPAVLVVLAMGYAALERIGSIDVPWRRGVLVGLGGASLLIFLLNYRAINARVRAASARPRVELWVIGPIVVLIALLQLADLWFSSKPLS
jgi:hypothetical protein